MSICNCGKIKTKGRGKFNSKAVLSLLSIFFFPSKSFLKEVKTKLSC